MIYITTPQEISFQDIQRNRYSFSPLQFRTIEVKNQNVKKIKDLLDTEPVPGKEVGSLAYTRILSSYRFVRTKACQDDNFQLDLNIPDSYEYIKPNDYFLNKGKNDERVVKENDLLFVTGGNVGEIAVAQDLDRIIFSSHFVKLPIKKYKFYVFAFLKNSFGKEQANFAPVSSIGGLDTFTRDTLLSIKIPFPNQSNKDVVIEYIELLVKAVINREKEIRKKNKLIIELIDRELLEKQKGNRFSYEYPNHEEIIDRNYRLETGMYTKEFKEMDFLLNNYQNGWQNLSDLNYDVSRGQNLQFTSIGKSIYSATPKKGFYQLALSKHFSEYATINKYEYVGNATKLKEIRKGDVIFSCRGAQFGRICIFCENVTNTITNIDNVHIRKDSSDMKNNIFICLFLNYLRKKGHLHRVAITGSGANSLTQYQFDLLKFPNFPDLKQEEISSLFYNPTVINKENFNLKNFKHKDGAIVNKSGVYQLDKQIKIIKEKLKTILYQIINDKEVKIEFDFYKRIC